MTPALVDRWMRRLRRTSAEPALVAPESLTVDLPSMVAKDFAAEYPLAADAAARVLAAVAGSDLAALARRSPSLAGFDWGTYLRCSICRVVRVQRALSERVAPGARVLDVGSYFGNFGLACQAMGFRVDAIDSYSQYGAALAPCVALQRGAGIVVHDFADTGYDLSKLGASVYDAVVCAGVIEHIPHTPRHLLEALTAILKPGGVLLLDTPNLGYLYKRLALLEGNSIFAPIAQQYFTDLPFEGHHREYTIAEIDWMLRAAGQEILSIDTFNYSVFGQSQLEGEPLAYHREMEADPALREIIFSVSRRPAAHAPEHVEGRI
jgi:2-polyprenyl-3-methyl-5-hydroxy-6-metoxy-1,4-benzoquinol methylase